MTRGDDTPPARFSETVLAAAAPLGLAWSRQHCRHRQPDGASCAAYHGMWGYLKWLRLINPPWADAPFLGEALAAAGRRGLRRLLVSGTADYGVPAVIARTSAEAGVPVEATVLDVCETPLLLTRWYAEGSGTAMATVTSDILDYRAPAPFEIVVSHAVLGYFTPAARRELLARWHGLLVPGGVMILVNRLRPGAPDLVRFTAQQADALRERVRTAALARGEGLGIDLDALLTLAEDYLAASAYHPVRGEAELIGLVEQAGFRIDAFGVRETPGEAAGPAVAAGARYAQLVATRG